MTAQASATIDLLCSIDGCTNPVKARGWCSIHYRRWREFGDPEMAGPGRQYQRTPVAERFWSKVDFSNPDGCWPWTGSMSNGYGEIWVDGDHD